MSGTLQTAMGGGNVLGLGALETLLNTIQGEGVGATNVASRIKAVLGGGQGLWLDEFAQAVAVANAAGTLSTVHTQIVAAVRSGDLLHLEDFAAAVKTVLTT